MALAPPPDGLDLGESRVSEMIGVLASTWTLAFIAVSLRFFVRRLRQTKILLEDWITLVSLVAASVQVFTTLGLMIPNGTGKHVWVGPPEAVRVWAIGLFISELSYAIVIATIKCSTLRFYWRIFGTRKSMKLMIWALFGVVMAWFIAVVLVTIFQCIPTRAFWDRFDPVNPISPTEFYCGVSSNMFFDGNSIPNIITDAFIVTMPIPYVLSLQMSKPHKFALVGVFMLGTFVTVISMVRFHAILSADLKSPDITWNNCSSIVWTNIEANIAIVCACLPSLKPLLSLAVNGTMKSTGARGDGSSGYVLSNGARFGARRGSGHLGSNSDNHITVKGSCPSHGNTSLSPAAPSHTTSYGSNYLSSKVANQITVKGSCPASEQDDERPFTRLSEGRSHSSLEEAEYNRGIAGKPVILVSQDFEVKSIIARKP